MNLPAWAQRTVSIWLTIGTILVLFGTNIVGLPSWLPGFFSESFVKATLAVIGAVINYWQVIRGTIAGHPDNATKLSNAPNKTAYMLLPWKMSA